MTFELKTAKKGSLVPDVSPSQPQVAASFSIMEIKTDELLWTAMKMQWDLAKNKKTTEQEAAAVTAQKLQSEKNKPKSIFGFILIGVKPTTEGGGQACWVENIDTTEDLAQHLLTGRKQPGSGRYAKLS